MRIPPGARARMAAARRRRARGRRSRPRRCSSSPREPSRAGSRSPRTSVGQGGRARPQRRWNAWKAGAIGGTKDGVDFRILGPLEVENAGGAIALGTAKQQALLGVLLLHPNEVVSGERLIDELWGERPPPTADKVVQTYVSQLRKCLGREAIVTRPPGYLLRVDEGAIDAGRFRRLTAEGRLRAADGDRERAEGLYREALALWRGPPLTGLVFESFARNEVERLEQERLAALIDGIDCGLA